MPLYKEVLINIENIPNIFIETGTHIGDGVMTALIMGFEKVYSVEYDEDLYKGCVNRFSNNSSIYLYRDDSALFLEKILQKINEPTVIFLDAHFCGFNSKTGLNEIWIPIINEMNAIIKYGTIGSTIIVDDLMAMDNTHFDLNTKKWAGAPGIDIIIDLGFKFNPNYRIYKFEDQIIFDGEDSRPIEEKKNEFLKSMEQERTKNARDLVIELFNLLNANFNTNLSIPSLDTMSINELFAMKQVLSKSLEKFSSTTSSRV
jgi:hypothetical protein